MAILLVSSDLLFRSKIESVAASLGQRVIVCASATALPAAEEAWFVAIVDLDEAEDSAQTLAQLRPRMPTAVFIGYGSHVEVQRQQQAKAAGFQLVLPRSAFVQRLPELLQLRQPAV